MRYRWVASVVALAVFFFHYVGAFMSWSLQVRPGIGSRIDWALERLWPLLSLPLFAVLPPTFIDLNWGLTMLANSAIWSGFAYLFVAFLLRRIART